MYLSSPPLVGLGFSPQRVPLRLIVMLAILTMVLELVLLMLAEIGKEGGNEGCLGTIESRSILQGELFAIWRGFLLAWDSGQKDIICETDYVEAFTIVNNLQDCFGFIDPLVFKIRDIMS
ncbi:RNA-directed DNA polymerase [Arachis hypogaea]|nr:RNA-directed DNA polymerase [Arachis hypogaea]